MAIVEGQKIKVRWNTKGKSWFESKGYKYTKMYDYFYVDAKDLMKYQKQKIDICCENCGEVTDILNSVYQQLKEDKQSALCKECSYTIRNSNRVNNISKKHKGNRLELYKEVLTGERELFPDGFTSKMTISESTPLVKHMVNLMIQNNDIKSIDELPLKIRKKHFIKYKLQTMADKFGVVNLILNAYPQKWKAWDFHSTPQSYWQDEENCREAIDWLFESLLDEGKLSRFNELPRMLTQRLLHKRGIGGMLKYYNKGIPELLMKFYPDYFNEWEFNVNKGYYQNDENKTKILNWFVDSILKDGVVDNIDQIPKKITRDTFIRYRLDSFLANVFSLSPFKAMDYLYPNRWKPWEFSHVYHGFWDDPRNVRNATIWCVEKCIKEGLCDSVEDLSNKNISNIFKQFKLAALYNKTDIPYMIHMIYGDEFNYDNHTKIKSNIDGEKLDSYEELTVHNIIARNFKDYKKQKSRFQFINNEFNESYIPDWIIKDNNIIVEYFGLYTEHPYSKHLQEYHDKTKRKINFFKAHPEYDFVDLYKCDLDDNYKGLKKKFKSIGIEISIE